MGWSDAPVAKQNFPFFLPPHPPPGRRRRSLAAAQQVTRERSQEGQEEVLSPLTEPHSDVRRHAVVRIVFTPDRLQAGPVGGGIRAGKAEERVGCKRKAKLILGAGGKMSSLGGPHLCSTGHLASAQSHAFCFSFINLQYGIFFSPPKKNWPSEGCKPQGGISSSYQLKLIQPQPGTFCHPCLYQECVPATAANLKPNSRGEFLRFGLLQLNHHGHGVPALGMILRFLTSETTLIL